MALQTPIKISDDKYRRPLGVGQLTSGHFVVYDKESGRVLAGQTSVEIKNTEDTIARVTVTFEISTNELLLEEHP